MEFLTLALLGSLAVAAPTPEGLDISASLQNILDNTHGSDLYTYPTDLTRGIVPKPIHSHNDYWRDLPFYSALSVGCVSIEADVWLYNNTLFVGHEQAALTTARTFQSLYIQPILNVLRHQNPTSQFVSSSTRNGVFDTAGDQTLYLFVDLKTDGTKTFPVVIEQLKPLRDAGYLTTFNGTSVIPGAVTVIGTGNTPLNQVQGVSPRDYFYDANFAMLDTTMTNITSNVSPIASAQFSRFIGSVNGTTLNSTQIATVRKHIATAKARGILGRYWDQPAWPISTRNAVWKFLVEEGIGLVNADDLAEAAGFGGINGYW